MKSRAKRGAQSRADAVVDLRDKFSRGEARKCKKGRVDADGGGAVDLADAEEEEVEDVVLASAVEATAG
eukprot:4077459-Pleurochrysis_carterae.AAC.1